MLTLNIFERNTLVFLLLTLKKYMSAGYVAYPNSCSDLKKHPKILPKTNFHFFVVFKGILGISFDMQHRCYLAKNS